MADVFQGRSATLVIGERTVDLRTGDEIPSGADTATVDAMRDAGAFTPALAGDALASELSANELAMRELGLVGDPERDLAPESDLVSSTSAGSYDDQTVEELQAEADRRGLTVEGTGTGGNVLKSDLVAALQADDAK